METKPGPRRPAWGPVGATNGQDGITYRQDGIAYRQDVITYRQAGITYRQDGRRKKKAKNRYILIYKLKNVYKIIEYEKYTYQNMKTYFFRNITYFFHVLWTGGRAGVVEVQEPY